MSVFVTQVGQQPGAVAVAAISLHRQFDLSEIVLLHSEGAKGTLVVAERLHEFLAAVLPSVRVNLCPVGPTDDQLVAEVIREQVETRGTDVLYDCGPGFNFFTARVARRLRGLDGLKGFYADFDSLWIVDEGAPIAASDLGLERLLALHGLRMTRGERREDVFTGVSIVDGEGTEVLQLGEAYELRGRLFGLLPHVAGLAEARRAMTLLKGSARLRGLRPSLLAVCDRPADLYRLRTVGLHAVRSNDPGLPRTLERWRARKPDEPGRKTPGPVEAVSLPQEAAGHGGEGPPLLVCLGNDPSATLTVLCSQRPRHACVLYDAQTPYVVALANRLAGLVGDLPTGRVQFVPTTLLGGSIGDDLVRTLFPDPGDVWANVGPGSKAQAWALGRLAQVQLSSLENRKRQVASIDPGASPDSVVPGSRWVLPPTLVQAECAGGRLAALALDSEKMAEQRAFYDLLVQYIGKHSFGDSGLFPMKSRTPKKGDGKDFIAVSHDSKDGHYRVEVTLGGVTQRGRLTAPFESLGMWLEEVVAAALLRAGGTDAVAGIRWDHLYERPGRDKDEFRTDIDAACQWRGAFVAVSVKTYTPAGRAAPGAAQVVDDWRQEILAEGRACFGRFCLPVLVRPIPRPETGLERILDEFRSNEVLEIGVCRLGDANYVRQLLDAAFEDRQTSLRAPQGGRPDAPKG